MAASAIIALASLIGSGISAAASTSASKKQAKTQKEIAEKQAMQAKEDAEEARRRETLIAAQTKERAASGDEAEIAIGAPAEEDEGSNRLRVGRASRRSSIGSTTGLSIG